MLFSVPASGITELEPQTVEAAVASSKLNRTAVTLDKGKTTQLTLSNSVFSKVIWRSSNSRIATVSNGIVKGVNSGTAYIYASYKGKTYKCKVTVKETKTFVLNKTSCTMNSGEKVSLTLLNAEKNKVSWRSSNISVASVSNGTVTAKAGGTATITARHNGKSYTCRVTVKKQENVRLSSSAADVRLGHSMQLKLLEASGPVTWRSENTKVATVSSDGKVTGIKKGCTNITARYKGKTYVCEYML